MTDTPGTPLTPECVFVPPNEPWTCSVHQGVRTSLDEPQCDIARPAEPFNDAHLDNLRTAIAEGRNPGSRYNVRRLLATLDRERRGERVDPDPDDCSCEPFDGETHYSNCLALKASRRKMSENINRLILGPRLAEEG